MKVRHVGTGYKSDAQMRNTVQSLRSGIQGLGYRSDTPGRSYTLVWSMIQTLGGQIQVRHSGTGYRSDTQEQDTGQTIRNRIQVRHSGTE
jgi:hypothetical protein